MKERLKRLLDRRFRLSAQCGLGIAGAVLPTLAAGVVGWLSFGHVADVQQRVTEDSVPEMAAAFEVAQYAGNLVALSPRLVTAPTPERLEDVPTRIAGAHAAFENELAALQRAGAEGANIERVSAPCRCARIEHRDDSPRGGQAVPVDRTESGAACRADRTA